MNTKRLRLLVIISLLSFALLLSVPAIEAQSSASITNVTCEGTHSGNSSFVHYTFTIHLYSMRGQNVSIAVWPRYYTNDALITHAGTGTTYEDRDGFIAAGDQLTPTSAGYIYHGDFSIPASVFPTGSSRYDVYPDIEVQAGGHAIETDTYSNCLVTIIPPSLPPVRPTATPRVSNILNPNLDPTFGYTRLRSGFTSDPYSTALITGGSVSIDAFLTGNCPGFAASAPDFQLIWSGSSNYLRFYFDSSEDTTMVVYAPNGLWYCDDDSGVGSDPQVSFVYPDAGSYYVWIGDYVPGNTTAGYLYISELHF